MGSVEMTCVDLESGGGSRSSAVNNVGKDENLCFSKAEEGSCYSQSNLAAGSSNHADPEIGQVVHARRASSVVNLDCIIDIEKGVDEVRKECRICMLSLDSESGFLIEFRCSCKNELGAAHQHCAEQWFKSKENRICEICKSIAQNVVVPNDMESRQQICRGNRFLTNAVSMLQNSFSPIAAQLNTFIPSESKEESEPVSRAWVGCHGLLAGLLVGVLFALALFIFQAIGKAIGS